MALFRFLSTTTRATRRPSRGNAFTCTLYARIRSLLNNRFRSFRRAANSWFGTCDLLGQRLLHGSSLCRDRPERGPNGLRDAGKNGFILSCFMTVHAKPHFSHHGFTAVRQPTCKAATLKLVAAPE